MGDRKSFVTKNAFSNKLVCTNMLAPWKLTSPLKPIAAHASFAFLWRNFGVIAFGITLRSPVPSKLLFVLGVSSSVGEKTYKLSRPDVQKSEAKSYQSQNIHH